MNDNLKKSLHERLTQILKFVEDQKKPYKYIDSITSKEVDVLKLDDLPCEFTLLMNDKKLINKQKTSLVSSLEKFLKRCNLSWQHFTDDHLHPVPNSSTFNKETYNPTLAYYAMKNKKVLWIKKSGEVRVDYLKHILTELKNE